MIVAGIVAAVVAIGAAATGLVAARRRGRPGARPAPPEPQDLGGGLHELADRVRPSVPPAVVARVDRIATTVDEIEPRLDGMGFASVDAHAVVRTATSYVPEALEAYMRLPRSFADTRKIQGSKTALAILCDQLDLLASKMDDVHDAVYRRDAQALIQHGQFLQARFSTGADLLGPAQGQT
ncbi:MAG TPA: hypothetical protein VIY72_09490 [Acidimicrobiales bacterium]